MHPLTPHYTQEILKKIAALPPDAAPAEVEETARELKAMNYQPMLLNDVPDFFHLTKERLSRLIGELTADSEKLTEQHLNLLVYHYNLLQRLRRNEPEAWDEVNELMEDD
jgi:hypothetical protein